MACCDEDENAENFYGRNGLLSDLVIFVMVVTIAILTTGTTTTGTW